MTGSTVPSQDDRIAALEQQVAKLALALGTLCAHIADVTGEWRVKAALKMADEIHEEAS